MLPLAGVDIAKPECGPAAPVWCDSDEDFVDVRMFLWACGVFHRLGLSRYIALLLRHQFAIPCTVFYEAVLDYARDNPDFILGQEYTYAAGLVSEVPHGIVLPEYGVTAWLPHEVSFLRMLPALHDLYNELWVVVSRVIGIRKLSNHITVLQDGFTFQERMIKVPEHELVRTFDSKHNFVGFFRGLEGGKPEELRRGRYVIRINCREAISDKQRFALSVLRENAGTTTVLTDSWEEDRTHENCCHSAG